MDSYLQENPDEKAENKSDSNQTVEKEDEIESEKQKETDSNQTNQKPEGTSFITLISKEEFDKLDKKNKEKFRKMQTLINALKEGKDRKEAMNLAGVNISSVMAWNTLGSRGNKLYVTFYNEYNELVDDDDSNDEGKTGREIPVENEYKPKELHYNKLVNQKMNIVLKLLSEGKSKKTAYDAANVTSSIVNSWIRSGETGNERYVGFYDEFNKITKAKSPKPVTDEKHLHNYSPENHKIIIDAIKNGKSRREAVKLAGIDLNDLEIWYQNGKNGVQPFAQFYTDYVNAREYVEEQKVEDREFKSEEIQSKLEIFIEEIKTGKTKNSAAEATGIPVKDINRWIYKGKQGKEPYIGFAEDFESARDYSIRNNHDLEDEIKSEVIELIKTGKTIGEASKIANKGKSEKDIIHWHDEGRSGNAAYQEFYHQCLEASKTNKDSSSDENIAEPEDKEPEITESQNDDNETFGFNYSKRTHKLVIDALKEGKSQEEAAEAAGISPEDLNNWFVNAHSNPYYSFYMDYISIKTNAFGENEDKELAENKDKIVVFFNAIRLGKSRKQAAKIADINLKLINKWISKGNQGKEPYVSIANEYKEARQSSTNQESDFNQKLKDETVELIKNGKTLEEAAKTVNEGKNENDIINWYSAGKFGDKNHKEFYLKCEEFSSNAEEENEDLTPELPDDETAKNKEESSKTEEIDDSSQDEKTPQKEEIETPPEEKSSLKSFTLNKSGEDIEILIKGVIENRNLISTLNGLKGFDEFITKIVTNSIDNDKMDLLIEIKTTESNINIIKKNLGILN